MQVMTEALMLFGQRSRILLLLLLGLIIVKGVYFLLSFILLGHFLVSVFHLRPMI